VGRDPLCFKSQYLPQHLQASSSYDPAQMSPELNVYRYCNGSPLSSADPNGLDRITVGTLHARLFIQKRTNGQPDGWVSFEAGPPPEYDIFPLDDGFIFANHFCCLAGVSVQQVVSRSRRVKAHGRASVRRRGRSGGLVIDPSSGQVRRSAASRVAGR